MAIESMHDLVGQTLGEYEIVEQIGQGGMATVFKARQAGLNRDVALKVLPPYIAQKEGFTERFNREAQAIGNLHHPNIVALFDAGMQGSHSFIVMEYVQGRTLKLFEKEQAHIPIGAAIDIIVQCCGALDYAHKQGVIHRDIKPSNILISDEGTVKLADFSIAHVNRTDDTVMTGLTGSPMYMSPEVVKEEVAGPQSDIYSLGVVMYKLFTGEVPFKPGNLHSVMYQIVNHSPKPITELRPDLPLRLAEIVEKCLHKDPAYRYQYGAELVHDLKACISDMHFKEEKIGDREKRRMLSTLTFFKGFLEEEIDEVHRMSTWISYRPGETIIQEGEVENSFYVLALGSVEVRKDDVLIDTLKTGTCFGEMGALVEEARSASVVAKSFNLIMRVNGADLEEASASCQLRFFKKFSQTLAERLMLSNERWLTIAEKPGRNKSGARLTEVKAASAKKAEPASAKKEQKAAPGKTGRK